MSGVVPGVVHSLTAVLGPYNHSVGRHGDEYIFTCPTCAQGHGKDKLWVNPTIKAKDGSKGTWICHREQRGGPLVGLLFRLGLQVEGDNAPLLACDEALRQLFEPSKDERPERVDHYLVEGVDYVFPPPESTMAWRYLIGQRGLSEKDIHQYHICMGIGKFRNRVIFPELDKDDEIVYWQARSYLDREPKYIGPKGSRDFHIWNLERIRGQYRAVNVLEGVLSGITAGLNSVATYSYGVLDSQVSLLVEADFEEYIVCFDGHPKAWAQAAKLVTSLVDRGVKETSVKIVILPLGTDTSELGPALSHWYLSHAYEWNPVMLTLFQTGDYGRLGASLQ